MAKLKVNIHNGEFVGPTDQERIAAALAEIKNCLRDPRPRGLGWMKGLWASTIPASGADTPMVGVQATTVTKTTTANRWACF
jgi:hypothetical protein